MNVTITQRQKAGGLFGQRDENYVDCVLEFSDAERRRIAQDPGRFLSYVLSARYDTPREAPNSPRKMKQGTFSLLIVAAVLFAFSLPNPGWGGIAGVMMLVAAAVGSWLYGTWYDYEGYRASAELPLGAVINQPRFVLYATNQERARETAADLRERLSKLDAMLASG